MTSQARSRHASAASSSPPEFASVRYGKGVADTSPTGWTHEGATSLDLRLLRVRALAELAAGRLEPGELCDATNELVDAACSFGTELRDPCPVCARPGLRRVSYGFGRGLPPSGQVIGGLIQFEDLASVSEASVCVVEVCPSCRWNFLIERRFGSL